MIYLRSVFLRLNQRGTPGPFGPHQMPVRQICVCFCYSQHKYTVCQDCTTIFVQNVYRSERLLYKCVYVYCVLVCRQFRLYCTQWFSYSLFKFRWVINWNSWRKLRRVIRLVNYVIRLLQLQVVSFWVQNGFQWVFQFKCTVKDI